MSISWHAKTFRTISSISIITQSVFQTRSTSPSTRSTSPYTREICRLKDVTKNITIKLYLQSIYIQKMSQIYENEVQVMSWLLDMPLNLLLVEAQKDSKLVKDGSKRTGSKSKASPKISSSTRERRYKALSRQGCVKRDACNGNPSTIASTRSPSSTCNVWNSDNWPCKKSHT
jgi:hypothetical protein